MLQEVIHGILINLIIWHKEHKPNIYGYFWPQIVVLFLFLFIFFDNWPDVFIHIVYITSKFALSSKFVAAHPKIVFKFFFRFLNLCTQDPLQPRLLSPNPPHIPPFRRRDITTNFGIVSVVRGLIIHQYPTNFCSGNITT